MRNTLQKLVTPGIALLYGLWSVVAAHGYAFNQIVPDVRQPASVSGGFACPLSAHQLTAPGSIAVQWSTILGTSPQSILTSDQTSTGRHNEIQEVIQQSMAVLPVVAPSSLSAISFGALAPVANANLCGTDGVNS